MRRKTAPNGAVPFRRYLRSYHGLGVPEGEFLRDGRINRIECGGREKTP